MAGLEALIVTLAANQAGERRNGEPGSGVAGLAVEAGELLFGDVFQVTGQLRGKAEAVAGTLGIDRFEQLLQFRDRQGDPLAQERQRLAFRREDGIENQIGQEAAEQGAGGVLEVIAVRSPGVSPQSQPTTA
jgi:hypothetical protein